MKHRPESATTRVTTWVGSVASLVLHTAAFILFFLLVAFDILALQTMLLILTTVVSLEAIYLAIFIQMTVNMNTESLREVEEDIDEIQEDVEEIGEDLDEIHEEDEEDELRDTAHAKALDRLSKDIYRLLADIETLKKKK